MNSIPTGPAPSTPQFFFTIPAPQVVSAPAAPTSRRINKALWLIGIGLCANALVMLYSHAYGQVPEFKLASSAMAQSSAAPAAGGQLLGARGIYMMPAQLGPQSYGVYLLDVDSNTICVYRAIPDTSHFRLMATRSFKYDRFLEDLNNDPLTPKDVQKLVESQRQRQELQQKDAVPTVDQTPKPDENSPDLPPAKLPG